MQDFLKTVYKQMQLVTSFEIVNQTMGALLIISATGVAKFGLFDFGGSGPAGGAPAPLDAGYPLPEAPRFGLIGRIGEGKIFFVGSGASIPVNRQSAPMMLKLGTNDGELWDNSGEFDCVVVLYR